MGGELPEGVGAEDVDVREEVEEGGWEVIAIGARVDKKVSRRIMFRGREHTYSQGQCGMHLG